MPDNPGTNSDPEALLQKLEIWSQEWKSTLEVIKHTIERRYEHTEKILTAELEQSPQSPQDPIVYDSAVFAPSGSIETPYARLRELKNSHRCWDAALLLINKINTLCRRQLEAVISTLSTVENSKKETFRVWCDVVPQILRSVAEARHCCANGTTCNRQRRKKAAGLGLTVNLQGVPPEPADDCQHWSLASEYVGNIAQEHFESLEDVLESFWLLGAESLDTLHIPGSGTG